jgi:3-deoxy-D-manno-octulosonic-acid transferase
LQILRMNLAYKAYKAASSSLFLALFPPFWCYARISGRYQESMKQRLGFYPDRLVRSISGAPRVWIHAVSVGEVRVALAILDALSECLPDAALILSTGTEQGQAVARESAGRKVTSIYAPFDFILSARNALTTIRPDILVCVETEIWPNWLVEARRMGIKTVLVNGRISVRSIRRYLKIRPLMKDTLSHVDAFSMIGQADADRIRMMGAPEDRVKVNGNAKYDLLLKQADDGNNIALARYYNLNGRQAFVAGSTRGAEVNIVLDAFDKILQVFPETVLIIAPRHIERVAGIAARIRERGWRFQLRSDLEKEDHYRTAPVVILDTIGELHATYSFATVVFCGSSLVPLGGQNILEAAVWSKPVLYGPSMDDFMDAKQLIEKTGGGIQVENGSELVEKVLYFLKHPREAEAVGKRAYEAVLSHQGAAPKHAAVIYRLLKP